MTQLFEKIKKIVKSKYYKKSRMIYQCLCQKHEQKKNEFSPAYPPKIEEDLETIQNEDMKLILDVALPYPELGNSCGSLTKSLLLIMSKTKICIPMWC